MTTTLCIETSGTYCSLALATGEQVHEISRKLGRTHNAHLLAMLDELFKDSGCRPGDLELIAFSCGPGSFTGVRLGAAVAQSVATGAGALRVLHGRGEVSVVGVSSSWIIARSAQAMGVTADRLLTSIRSRGDAYYLALYGSDAHGNDAHGNDAQVKLEQPDELTESTPGWCLNLDRESTVIVGARPGWLDGFGAAVPTLPDARVMLALARQEHAQGRSGTAETALPRYLKGDSPWAKKRLAGPV
jgi:tRNA threonylcarbamoyladenosine biosynthesis protein TsaB